MIQSNLRGAVKVDRVVRETGEVVENGLSEIYVNARAEDESDVSALMSIFVHTDAYDYVKFPKTSARKEQFKQTKKKAAEMCAIVEECAREAAEKASAEAAAEADAKRIIGVIENCAAALNSSLEKACSTAGISVDKYKAAKELISGQLV